jgi:pimeloyl-ACP methyl ester carboxylesterase
MRSRVVLVHGAATTPAIWRAVTPLLDDFDVVLPQRRYSGDLDVEVADLATLCGDAIVVGVSGGATLVLELARRQVPYAAAIAHEPAAGSLCPGLLDHVIAAWEARGVEGFGAALYGPAWTIDDAPDTEDVARDLAMFRGFEPSPLPAGAAPLLLTVGGESPPIREQSVSALSSLLPTAMRVLPQARHAVHLEHPELIAALVQELDS